MNRKELSFMYPFLGSAGFRQSIGSYIPSTQPQHRSSKGSRRPTKARKPGSFRKRIPIRRMHNRTDKLTLTRQFWIQDFPWGVKEWECNTIDSYRRKGSRLIQMRYKGRVKKRGSTFDRKRNMISFVPFAQ